MEFWSYPSKQWNSGPISVSIGILILSLQTLEFLPYFYKHWHFFQTLELLSYSSKHCNTDPIFKTLEFWLCPLNTGILILFFQSLQFWHYGPILINIGTAILFFQSSEFWSYLTKHCNSCVILPNFGILTLSF